MIKAAAVITLILVPLLWGSLMVPVLDLFERVLSKNRGGESADE